MLTKILARSGIFGPIYCESMPSQDQGSIDLW